MVKTYNVVNQKKIIYNCDNIQLRDNSTFEFLEKGDEKIELFLLTSKDSRILDKFGFSNGEEVVLIGVSENSLINGSFTLLPPFIYAKNIGDLLIHCNNDEFCKERLLELFSRVKSISDFLSLKSFCDQRKSNIKCNILGILPTFA